jgi:hypothetical protein
MLDAMRVRLVKNRHECSGRFDARRRYDDEQMSAVSGTLDIESCHRDVTKSCQTAASRILENGTRQRPTGREQSGGIHVTNSQ